MICLKYPFLRIKNRYLPSIQLLTGQCLCVCMSKCVFHRSSDLPRRPTDGKYLMSSAKRALCTHVDEVLERDTNLHWPILLVSMQRLQGTPARLASHFTFRSWHGMQAWGFWSTPWLGRLELSIGTMKFLEASLRGLGPGYTPPFTG